MQQKIVLKDLLFNKQKVEKLAREISAVYPEFNSRDFVQDVVRRFPSLELKARISWIAECLKKYLPPDYKKALQIILAALPPENNPNLTDDDFGDFIYAPYGDFVAKSGCSEKHLTISLKALHAITKRFSMEDSIRYFINAFPEQTLQTVLLWTKDTNYHVRRLCSEGTRPSLPWSQKIGLSAEQTIPILNLLYFDTTRYVTRSVANHLNDISKKDSNLVLKTLKSWQKSKKQNKEEMEYITRHSLRTLVKQGNKEALAMLGFDHTVSLRLSSVFLTKKVVMNSPLSFSFDLESDSDAAIIVDYIIHFQNKSGKLASKKVFKLTKAVLRKNEPIKIIKNHILREKMTTRTLYSGQHRLEIQINGVVYAVHDFLVHK